MINKYGDNGSPHLKPIKGLKLPKGDSLRRIEKYTNDMHSLTILVKYS